METALEAAKMFESAAYYVKQNSGRLEAETLMFFYARFKQAKFGPCNKPKPGFLQFEEKKKWEAWKSLGTMPREQAMKEYVSEVYDMDSDWHEKMLISGTNVDVFSSLSGNSVSKFHNPDLLDKPEEGCETAFDWCKEGNISKLSGILQMETDINIADEEGMSLLHWACDRGHEEIVQLLLQRGFDVNQKANDGQSPLHYAVSCEYHSIVQLLLDHAADVNVTNSDGEKPADMTDNAELLELLRTKAGG